MNIYFNDLTLVAIDNANVGEPIYSRFLHQVLKQVLEQTRLKHICCNDREKIKEKCLKAKNGILAQSFYTYFRAPYVESDFAGTAEEERFSASNFYIMKGDAFVECIDLGSAIMKNSVALGLFSEPFWESLSHTVRERDGQNELTHEVLCLTQEGHLRLPQFRDWLEKTFDSEPEEDFSDPNGKPIKLRDDHGKDKLLDFARKICRSAYVKGVVNSLPFKPKQNVFINMNQSFEGGLIEICLHWTPQGLGMVLQTTAGNRYQAIKIAESLTDAYDQGS